MILKHFEKNDQPIAIDELTDVIALPPGEVQASVLFLELQGLPSALLGNQFVLAPGVIKISNPLYVAKQNKFLSFFVVTEEKNQPDLSGN